MNEDFLTRMAALKRAELRRLKREVPLRLLKRSVREAPPPRALRLPPPFEGLEVIAEVKRASPSAGDIDVRLDPAELAGEYAGGGAVAVSVLTESSYFKGSVQDLVLVRSRVGVPVLRKDFIIDPYDLYRSRGLGADLVLLIAAMLDPGRLRGLFDLSLELGMTPLVEIHSAGDLRAVEGLVPPLVGVNNRNLKTLNVSMETSLELAPRLLDCFPEARLVAESGVDGPETARKLAGAGYSAVLVGEYLVRRRDRRKALAGLRSTTDAVSSDSIQGKAS